MGGRGVPPIRKSTISARRCQHLFSEKNKKNRTKNVDDPRFPIYCLRMNSMIDPQNEVANLATVAPEEFYGAHNGNDDDGPTCDDVAEPVYDDVADDAHQYVDDVY